MAKAMYNRSQAYASLVEIRTLLFSVKGPGASIAGSFITELTTAIDSEWWLYWPKSLDALLERIQEKGWVRLPQA